METLEEIQKEIHERIGKILHRNKLTLGQLKKIIADLPDEYPVWSTAFKWNTGDAVESNNICVSIGPTKIGGSIDAFFIDGLSP